MTVGVGEERRLVAAMQAAVVQHGYSVDQVREHALAALARAKTNPVTYVTRAFEEDNLPVPLDPDPYEFPPRLRAVEALPEVPEPGPPLPKWCGECGEGDPAAEVNPRLRYHGLGTDEVRKCRCHPDYEGAA